MVTTGGWESHYAARGINGPIDDLLFPIQHGVLFYPGFDVVPPFWMTLWFRALALAAIALLALGLHVTRLRSLRQRNAVLEQLYRAGTILSGHPYHK